MKNPSKKTLRNKLDKIVSEIVRARGYCVRCTRTEHLQAAHIFSRSNMATRFYLNNILCLCPDCHINFAHKNPILFTEWVKKFLGDEKYEELKVRAASIRKWELWELEDLYRKFSEIK